MPIQVTCPGCLKRFQVADKFAGKTGPCPSCSKPITIPSKSDEVVIHAPDQAGPKDSKGRPVFQPLRREEVKITLPAAMIAGVSTLLSIGIALIVRFTNDEPPTAILALGTIFLAPPLVYVGYWFLRDDELAGFLGSELIIRCAIVAVVFMITWGIYASVPMYLSEYKSLAEIELIYLFILVPLMILIGAAASVLALELEVVQGTLHYLLYFALTVILALIMGTQIARPFAKDKAGGRANPPAAIQPQAPGKGSQPSTSPSKQAAPAAPKSNDNKPKILQ